MTLTEAAFWTKRFGVIALGAFVVFVVVILAVTLQEEDAMPPQYLTANYACTKKREEFLENKLEIPSLKLADGSEMVFEILTDSGKIDALPGIVNVYKFNNPTQSLSAQANAKILANKLGFDPEAVIRRTDSYVWIDRETNRSLVVQAKNLNFQLTTESSFIKELSGKKSLPSIADAKAKAANVLVELGLYSDDYAKSNHTTKLIGINPDGTFKKVNSLDEADLIRVDFVRTKSLITIPSNIVGADAMIQSLVRKMGDDAHRVESLIVNDEKIEIHTFNTFGIYPQSQKSNISVYIGAENKDNPKDTYASVHRIDYTYWPVNVESCGTYELISPQVAIEKVQSGEGSLVYLVETGGDDIIEYTPKRVKKFSITDVLLAYYEDREELEYLQPVYYIIGEAIFENDTKGTFEYLYPAISYDIVQDKVVLPEVVIEEKGGLL
jgi:hypothetical protein